MKFGLVIQGPILSYGRTGKTGIISASKVEEKHVVKYDSNDSISKIINSFGKIFDVIVLSTWESEKQYLKKDINAETIFLDSSKAPAFKKIGFSKKTFHNNPTALDNRLKQFYSTFKGIEFIDNNFNVDFVVKIRTDMFIDLSKLTQHIESHYKSVSDKILIPHFTYGKIHFGDFYFAGNIQNMKNYFFYMSKNLRVQSSVHRELFFKYLYFVSNRNSIAYCSEEYANDWDLLRPHLAIFAPLPKKIYTKMIWRGEYSSTPIKSKLFWEDVKNMNNNYEPIIKLKHFEPILLKSIRKYELNYLFKIENYYLDKHLSTIGKMSKNLRISVVLLLLKLSAKIKKAIFKLRSVQNAIRKTQ